MNAGTPKRFRTRTNRKGIAIRGYDPVAYFTVGEPTKGSSDFTHQWADAEWHFSSAEHRDLFTANPTDYAPQFGGNCAVAAATAHRANTSPKSWRVEDGHLFLNHDPVANFLHGAVFTKRIHRLASDLRQKQRNAQTTPQMA